MLGTRRGYVPRSLGGDGRGHGTRGERGKVNLFGEFTRRAERHRRGGRRPRRQPQVRAAAQREPVLVGTRAGAVELERRHTVGELVERIRRAPFPETHRDETRGSTRVLGAGEKRLGLTNLPGSRRVPRGVQVQRRRVHTQRRAQRRHLGVPVHIGLAQRRVRLGRAGDPVPQAPRRRRLDGAAQSPGAILTSRVFRRAGERRRLPGSRRRAHEPPEHRPDGRQRGPALKYRARHPNGASLERRPRLGVGTRPRGRHERPRDPAVGRQHNLLQRHVRGIAGVVVVSRHMSPRFTAHLPPRDDRQPGAAADHAVERKHESPGDANGHRPARHDMNRHRYHPVPARVEQLQTPEPTAPGSASQARHQGHRSVVRAGAGMRLENRRSLTRRGHRRARRRAPTRPGSAPAPFVCVDPQALDVAAGVDAEPAPAHGFGRRGSKRLVQWGGWVQWKRPIDPFPRRRLRLAFVPGDEHELCIPGVHQLGGLRPAQAELHDPR